MHEILFSIGPITVYMWGLMLGLGVVAALMLLMLLCKHFKVEQKAQDFYFWNGIVAVAVGLFGAWAFQHVYDAIAGKPFSWGGFTFMGGLIGGAVSFVLGTYLFADRTTKNEFYRVANFAAPCIVLAHAFGRFGCFFAGCCYGKHSEHGLIFPYGASTGKVLPTQLYEALFLLALFGVMMLLIFYFKKRDFLLILYGAAYAVFRFIIEFYRDDYRGGRADAVLSPSQWQSIFLVLIIVGLAVLVYRFKITPFYKQIPAASTGSSNEITISETTTEDELDESKMAKGSTESTDSKIESKEEGSVQTEPKKE